MNSIRVKFKKGCEKKSPDKNWKCQQEEMMVVFREDHKLNALN